LHTTGALTTDRAQKLNQQDQTWFSMRRARRAGLGAESGSSPDHAPRTPAFRRAPAAAAL